MEEENKVEVVKVVEEEKSGGGFAIVSLICSLVGLLFYGLIFGIIAVIFGLLGLNSKRSGLAVAGLVIGTIDIVVVLFFASLFF